MVGIEPDLHKEFKIACAKNQESFSQAITDLIKYYIITTNEPLKLKENANK